MRFLPKGSAKKLIPCSKMSLQESNIPLQEVPAPLQEEPEVPECPVCYNELGENPPLPCGHTLCVGCENRIKNMAAWEAGGRRCPLCRAPMTPPVQQAPPPPPPVDARIQRLTQLGVEMNSTERQYRRAQNQLQRAQNYLNRLMLDAGRLSQEWNNLLGTDVSGTTSQFANGVIQNPNHTLLTRIRNGYNAPVVQPAPVVVQQAPIPPPMPAPQPVAQNAVAQGHKCGHRGCNRHGPEQGVRFRRMTNGQRLFRCLEHIH